MLTEPVPEYRVCVDPITGARVPVLEPVMVCGRWTGEMRRMLLAYVIEARTPAGWMPAAEAATLLWAVAYVEAGDGLSRLVPEYRVTRGGVEMWRGRAGAGRAFGRPRRNEED
jgi:hypothetical protein